MRADKRRSPSIISSILCAAWICDATAQMPPERMMEFAAQSVCIDEAGHLTSRMPIDQDCTTRRLQRNDDVAPYRKHDWPNDHTTRDAPLGYQASDSVSLLHGQNRMVLQTFDFGTNGRTFGHFDAHRGDGGQLLVFVGHWASFVMTEDGTGGLQWFLGERCRKTGHYDPLGWLSFASDAAFGNWSSTVARLTISSHTDTCPREFNDAYTRYRRDKITLPFKVLLARHNPAYRQIELETIVSEHYGGSAIATADHLERFYFAAGLGLVRWERWANAQLPQSSETFATAAALGRTARCPPIQNYAEPGSDWIQVDCRTWTLMVQSTSRWRVADYAWPNPTLLSRLRLQ